MLRRAGSLILFCGLALGAPLAACSTTETATPTSLITTTETPTSAPASVVTTTTAPNTAPNTGPTSVLEADLTGVLSAEVQQWMASTGAPGLTLAAILPSGEEITLAFGTADLRTDRPAATTDYWRFGSITKPMTSAVVLLLAEQGLIDLDAPVTDYLGDDWAAGYEIDGVDYGPLLTVRQLLNHTNGFAEYAFDPGFFILAGSRLDQPFTPEEVVQWAVDRGPLYVPGTSYQYTTVGHVAAGMVIEAVTGQDAHEVLRELLFEPSGAAEIYLPPAEFPPQMVAGGYAGGELQMALSFLPGFAALAAQAQVDGLLDITSLPQEVLTSAPFTGGGIEAQALDVAKVVRALFSGELLSDASVAEFSEQVPDQTYALGIDVTEADGLRVYSHGGGVPGFRSHALTVPELDLTFAMSTNLIPVDPDIGVLADALLAAVRSRL